jgi:hypothetical protein
MAAGPSYDELYAEILKRMIEGGEWDREVGVSQVYASSRKRLRPHRILSQLKGKLNESGWIDSVGDDSKGL